MVFDSSMFSTPLHVPIQYCKGVLSTPCNSDLLLLSQKNYRKFLISTNPTEVYCSELLSIKNCSESAISLDGLMGFFLPRKFNIKKLGSEMIMKPSSFYYSVHDGKNSFRIQSYDCALNKNVAVANNESCSDCRNFWRSFRNNTADKYLEASSHNKIIREKDKKLKELRVEFEEHVKNKKTQWATINQKMNKLLKRVSYWKKKYKTLQSAVVRWRKVEDDRNGFVVIEEDDATIWGKFYDFIDKQIDKEHYDNDEKRDLHKELIRTETISLGKFNARKDKRGIRTTKISSRILNYSMTLANKLGKVQYENEAQLRSLPTWDTISR